MTALERLKKRRARRRAVWAAWWGVVALSLAAPGIFIASASMPIFELPDAPSIPQTSRVLDRHGNLLAVLHGEENRYIIPRSRMPKHLRQAIIAAEDQKFYLHPGVSVPAVFRASLANLASDRVVQGGSTITQQYVRNAYAEIGKERTLRRKLREAVLAFKLEEENSKDEILDKYINTVYFGRGAYGVEAAARTFFRKPTHKLELHESAMLAGMIRAPETYVANRREARGRRNEILREMAELDFITPAQAKRGSKAELVLRRAIEEPVRAAHFVEYVRRLLRTPKERGGFGLTDREILTGGLTIHTTLDMRLQKAAERATLAVFPRPSDPEVGLVSMRTNGEILAMVGSRNFNSLEAARGFNFAAQTGGAGGRSPGSAFKPFTLAAFIEQGFSVRSVFSGASRISIPSCNWKPANYGGASYGGLSVVEATAKSVNTVFAQLIARVGPSNVADIAYRAGITSPLTEVCSLTLGTSGVTPLEMARAFSTFSARGQRPEVIAVSRIVGPDGQTLVRRKPKSEQTISRRVADAVNQVLRRVMTSGTGTVANISGANVAGKTGTSEEHKDVSFVGYTAHPGVSTHAWVGYPPNESGRIRTMYSVAGQVATGGRFPGKVWNLYMREAIKIYPDLPFPAADFGGSFAGGGKCVDNPDDVDPYLDAVICASPTATPENPEPREPEPKPKPKKKEPPAPPPSPPPPSPPPPPPPSPSPTASPDGGGGGGGGGGP